MRLTRILIDALSTTSMTRRAAGLKPCSLRLRRQQNEKLILYGLDATSVIAAAGERGLPLRTTYMFMHTPNAGSCRLNDQRRAKKSLNKLRPSSGGFSHKSRHLFFSGMSSRYTLTNPAILSAIVPIMLANAGPGKNFSLN